LYGSVLSDAEPIEPPIGLGLGRSLLGISPEDEEKVRREKEQQDKEIDERVSGLCASEPRAMSELRRLGVDERRIVVHLWGIWFARRKKTKRLSAVPRVPLREIKRLPDLLRKLAGKVDAINKYGYSLTGNQMLMLMFSPILQSRYMAGKRLAGSLRLYAHDLSMRLANRTAPKVEPGTEWKVQTVEFTRETSTDKGQHYEVIALLMNAFNKMEDEKEGETSKTVTPASLKQLWLAHPGLRKPAKPAEYPAVEMRSISGMKILPPPGKLN
jgi:hypothetical protein